MGLGAAHEIELAAVRLDHHDALLPRFGGDVAQRFVHVALGNKDFINGATRAQRLNDGVAPLDHVVFIDLAAVFFFFFHSFDLTPQ